MLAILVRDFTDDLCRHARLQHDTGVRMAEVMKLNRPETGAGWSAEGAG
jgi:hypothetical protein